MPETNWTEYLLALSAFAGTVFALVLAARQIRGGRKSGEDPLVLDYRLADSIAVTAELAIAAGFGILYRIAPSVVFHVFVCLLALTGAILSGRAVFTYAQARGQLSTLKSLSPRKGHLTENQTELLQAIGNVLPLVAYATAFSYGTGWFSLDSASIWGFVTAATWLTFSGCFQAIAWYSRVWLAGESEPDSSA